MAQLYESSRLYVNFFQPSFKLKSKTRDGARVHKVYYPPATPCERLVAHGSIGPDTKERLTKQLKSLDPVRLLQEIPIAQQRLIDIASLGAQPEAVGPSSVPDVAAFLRGLSDAWKDGEVRPTHQKNATARRWWRSRVDPFADSWPVIEGWLNAEPSIAAKDLMNRLVAMIPEIYGSHTQLRTLQRRVKAWRSARVTEMILGGLRKSATAPVEV